jgi:hypothetical protein
MSQIQCPVCTLLNNSTNTNCDVCDSILNPNAEQAEANPLEDEFMQLTGSTRSDAREYLDTTNNDLGNAISYYYNDKELGTSNSQFIQTNNTIDSFFRFLSSIDLKFEEPSNVKELILQYLYRRGFNKPHYCPLCDSRAYLVAIKFISHKESTSNFIRFFQKEDLEKLNIKSPNYDKFREESINIINNEILPKICENMTKYFNKLLQTKVKILEKSNIEEFNNLINYKYGPNFKIIWDTIFQSNSDLDEEKINNAIKELINSSDFHSFINNSWDTPVFNHPASEEVISSLKTIKIEKDCKEFQELKDTKCAICMQDFEEDGREVTMLGCHNFCKDCIMPWLENHNDTCPVCRNKIGSSVEITKEV